jgi:hypothetical protein
MLKQLSTKGLKMTYKIFLFLMAGLLVGCQSSKDIKPVESGKVVMVKTWPKEQDDSLLSAKKGDLNTVSLKEKSPWDSYNRAFGKDLENPPKLGKGYSFPESNYT